MASKYLLKIFKIHYLFLTTLILFGCGSKIGSDSPTNAVKDFVASVKEKNFNKAWGYLNEKSRHYYENSSKVRNISGREYFEKSMLNSNSLGILNETINIVDQKQDGDAAVVIVKSADNSIFELYTSKEDDVWKFDFIKSMLESIKQESNQE